MAILVTPTNLQKLEYDVTTAAGPSHVTVVTGMISANVQAGSNSNQSGSFKALVDPQLNPGQFIKATATASMNSLFFQLGVTPGFAVWRIDEVEATFDDESGRVQLRVDATVGSSGNNSNTQLVAIGFQVTTLAKI